MRVMKAITENQRAALEFIGRDPSRYFKAGDIDGAKEILQEVISEGDSEQKAAAESVLASLG